MDCLPSAAFILSVIRTAKSFPWLSSSRNFRSYNRLGKYAGEKDAEEIIDMASKAFVADQQKQVQENVHFQIKNICRSMDDILLCDPRSIPDSPSSVPQFQSCSQHSGLSFAIGRGMTPTKQSDE